jgi:hypothetical protein
MDILKKFSLTWRVEVAGTTRIIGVHRRRTFAPWTFFQGGSQARPLRRSVRLRWIRRGPSADQALLAEGLLEQTASRRA